MAYPSHRDLVGKIAKSYPNQHVDRAHYEDELADVPVEVLAPTLRAMLRVPREWAPTVGDVRAACAERVLGLPDERAALRQIEERRAWARAGRHGEPPPLHPLVRAAVEHVGGWYALRVADRPEVLRGQLLRYYREARDLAVRECAAADLSAAA